MIYLDSCIVIYAVENHPRWGEPSRAALTGQLGTNSAISPLVKLECLVGPLKHGDRVLEARFREFFVNSNQIDMPEAVYLLASELRARFGLKTSDALHLACAQHHRCDALWTNDGRLNKASHGLARNVFAR
jgi:predicted nucleic acid-binding protein